MLIYRQDIQTEMLDSSLSMTSKSVSILFRIPVSKYMTSLKLDKLHPEQPRTAPTRPLGPPKQLDNPSQKALRTPLPRFLTVI